MRWSKTLLVMAATMSVAFSGIAQAGPLAHLFDRKTKETSNDERVTYDGRYMYVFAPSHPQPAGSRALVIVMHGGGGNAERIVSGQSEHGLNMDSVAEHDGFIVAYLNGTKVMRLLGDDKKGWNAGNCCGKAASDNVDDVNYISGAVKYLTEHYGIDPRQVYGIGHSNGAMMAIRMVCETDVFAAIMPVSGALGVESGCSHASGKYIYAIRGQNDDNVPYAGGVGKGPSRTDFTSQEHTKQVFEQAGAHYTLQIVPDAEHNLDTIEKGLQQSEGVTLAQKAASFFVQHPLR